MDLNNLSCKNGFRSSKVKKLNIFDRIETNLNMFGDRKRTNLRPTKLTGFWSKTQNSPVSSNQNSSVKLGPLKKPRHAGKFRW